MRVAAAHAIEAITGCFKHSSVMELYNLVEAQMKEACINSSVEDLVFLNVITLHEYELASDFSNNPKERAKRKQNLKRRLVGFHSWVSQELRYCAQCLIIENEDFVKEIAVCVLSYLKWRTTFGGNLFGLYGDEDLTNLAKCLIIENEDFVKEITVCLYIRSMSSTSWIVQDIRHKLGRFNFFIKFVILYFLHQ
ncbi:hypothetical protein Tco_0560792 [Tanacetum coccineum]